ncbi:MAG: glycosyltransferase [Candidatus Taylorbacteria bacterium]
MNPKVSVIIATFNRESFIVESIESVRKQTFKEWEMIIIDDASTDNTKDVVARYITSDPRIVYYRNDENKGISKTRNRGLSLAKGIYIAALDSDDIWLDDNKLKSQVDFLDANPDYALIGGGIVYIDENSKPIKKTLYPIYDSVIRNIILQYNPFPHSSVLFRKDVALEVGGYAEEPQDSVKRNVSCEDYDLWLKIGLKHKFTNIPKAIVGYRVHGGNLARSKRLIVAGAVLEIVKRYKKNYKRPYLGITKAYLRVLGAYMKC